MRRKLILVLLLLLLPGLCAAEWYTFPPDAVPKELTETSMLVREGEAKVTLSFLGDCTLGGEAKLQRTSGSFASIIRQYGYEWPFSGVSELLLHDDGTLVNLEGVLSDQRLIAAQKEYCFIGKTAYTEILRLGGVDAVTLSNNHSLDYGSAGLNDTKRVLRGAGIAFVSGDTLCVCDLEGIRIGFTASSFTLDVSTRERLRQQVVLLRELGCDAIVHSMHAGQEYARIPNTQQRDTALYMAELGVELVIGHHPHIAQGMELIGSTTVFYSLGNAVFGGNSSPSETDALLVQADFTLKGEDIACSCRIFPISITSSRKRNDYHPVLLDEEGASHVSRKLTESTGYDASALIPSLNADTQ